MPLLHRLCLERVSTLGFGCALLLCVLGCKDESVPDHPLVNEDRMQEILERYQDPEYSPFDMSGLPRRHLEEPPEREVRPLRGPAIEAMDVYRELIEAYAAGDADAYLSGFTDPVECFYDRRGIPRDQVRNARQAQLRPGRGIIHLQPIWSGRDAIEFVEDGWSGQARHQTALPQRLRVRMAKAGGQWRVSHVARDDGALCGDPVTEVPPDAFYAALESSWTRHAARCEGHPPEGRCAPTRGFPDVEALCRPRLGCPLAADIPCPGLTACRTHLEGLLAAFLGPDD